MKAQILIEIDVAGAEREECGEACPFLIPPFMAINPMPVCGSFGSAPGMYLSLKASDQGRPLRCADCKLAEFRAGVGMKEGL